MNRKAPSSRRLEFVYIDAGGGHRSATIALESVVKELYPDWDVKLVNLFEDVFRSLDPLHRATGAHKSENLYNHLVQKDFTYGFSAMMRGLQSLIKIYRPRLERLMRERWKNNPRPDLVVSLIPNFNGIMFRALRQVHPTVPYVTIMTDIADCPPHCWQEKQDQFMICGSEIAVRQAIRMGYRSDKIFQASGMILKPNFYRQPAHHDRAQERKKLHLEPHKITALIMFGGLGSIVAESIVTTLSLSGLPVQYIVMCGHNEALREALKTKKSCHAVGFTPDGVQDYMRLADFFIGKPGPGSLNEALHMGLAVVVERNKRTMPQELYNTTWVKENKFGLVIRSFKQIDKAVAFLLEGHKLEHFQENARKIQNRAVYEIPKMLEEIMNRPPEESVPPRPRRRRSLVPTKKRVVA